MDCPFKILCVFLYYTRKHEQNYTSQAYILKIFVLLATYM